MKLKRRSLLQIIVILAVAAVCFVYNFYIDDIINFKILSIGDMNPYGGWSTIKSLFTDLSYKWRGFSKSMALTAALSVSALFFGRFFCGYICPVGALQDFFNYIGRRLGLKEIKLNNKHFKFEIIKFIVLIVILILSIFELGNLISPFSPWLAYLNFFMGLNFNVGSLVLLLILLISLFTKRIFCRSMCPLGAFQTLLYAIGPFKLYKPHNCGGCKNCIKNCPVDIDSSEELVISPECINCSECTSSVCIKGYEGYKYKFAKQQMKHYVLICMSLIMSIYIVLPLLPFSSEVLSIRNIDNLNDGIYTGKGIGFGCNLEIEVIINSKEIKNISIMEHSETTGYYEEVFKIMAKDIVATQNLNVEVISGATATSRGLLNAVKDAVSKSLY
jgi:uncharacterized protein with FMN-binding domain/ferredoxin